MSADALLSRIDRPRKTGADSWICRCPAHEDKSPSMTVRELPDGRVLLHCFAGCDVESILGAVGLTFDALFPAKTQERARPLRRPFPAADVLEALAVESLIVQLAAADMARGEPVDDGRRARLLKAAARIQHGRELALG